MELPSQLGLFTSPPDKKQRSTFSYVPKFLWLIKVCSFNWKRLKFNIDNQPTTASSHRLVLTKSKFFPALLVMIFLYFLVIVNLWTVFSTWFNFKYTGHYKMVLQYIHSFFTLNLYESNMFWKYPSLSTLQLIEMSLVQVVGGAASSCLDAL